MKTVADDPIMMLVLLTLLVLILLVVVIYLLRKSTNLQREINFDTLVAKIDFQEQNSARIEAGLKNDIAANRMELNRSFKQFEDSLLRRLHENMTLEKQQYDSFSGLIESMKNANEQKLGQAIEKIDIKLETIRRDNGEQLEKMRETVDEKLSTTLENRLSESFRSVSMNLEQVQKGLGEMRTLASGVGDLKKVLSNVKTKGVLGEYQLEAILEMILAPGQYEKNVKTHPERGGYVEFAVRLPGKAPGGKDVWLPIDSKFPTEPYVRLMEAYEDGDGQAVETARRKLDTTIRRYARDIRDKYVYPPDTTPFALLFLPFEGLYAELLRTPGLFEALQREYRITLTGPTTLSAFLSSLRMGFNTLAIERHSNEVWELLGTVRREFVTFGEVLQKTRRKLEEASRSIDSAETRSRVIERKLRKVGELERPLDTLDKGLSEPDMEQG